MYVGPWQEYKLMKVIEDLREEKERLQALQLPPIPAANATSGASANDHGITACDAMEVDQHLSSEDVAKESLRPRNRLPRCCEEEEEARLTTQRLSARYRGRTAGFPDVFLDYRYHHSPMPHPACSFPPGHPMSATHLTGGAPDANGGGSWSLGVGEAVLEQSAERPLTVSSCSSAGRASTPVLPGSTATAEVLKSALKENPVARDLVRRVPLDTKTIGRRAGQMVYRRCGLGEAGVSGLQNYLAATADGPRQGVGEHGPVGSGKPMRRTKEGFDEQLAMRERVERRMHLQALYQGSGDQNGSEGAMGMAIQASVPNGTGTAPPSPSGESKVPPVADSQPVALGTSVARPKGEASPVGWGVPWDNVQYASASMMSSYSGINRAETSTAPPIWQDDSRVASRMVSDPSGDSAVVGGNFPTRPAPAEDMDDIGELVQWAENLDLDLIDQM